MAKQIEDTKNPDMIGEPKKRGRPSTGKAMTSAERQQKRRRDAMRAVWATGSDLTTLSTTGLMEEFAGAVRGGYSSIAKALASELLRRAEIVEAEKRQRQDAGA